MLAGANFCAAAEMQQMIVLLVKYRVPQVDQLCSGLPSFFFFRHAPMHATLISSALAARAKLDAQVKAHYAEHAAGAGAELQADAVQEEYAAIKAQVRNGPPACVRLFFFHRLQCSMLHACVCVCGTALPGWVT